MSDDTPAPAPAPPARPARPRGRLALRIALAAGAFVVLIIAAFIAVIASVWHSEAGTRWLLERLPGITVVDVRGSLGGELRIGSMHIVQAGAEIDITDLRLRGLAVQRRPYPGAWAGVRISDLSAATVHVKLPPSEPDKGPPKPPASLRSPVALAVARLHVGALVIGEIAPLRDVDATALALGAEDGAAHRVDALRFAWERVQAQGRLRAGTDTPLPIDLELDAHDAPPPAAAPVADGGASAPLLAHWSARATLKGPLETMALAASLRGEPSAGGGRVAQADVEAHVTPFAGFPVGDITARTEELDLGAFSSDWPATRLAGTLRVATTKPAAFDVQLRNLAPRAWSAHGLPIAELTGKLEAPWNIESLSVPALRLVLKDGDAAAGELRAQGRWAGGKADVQLDLDQVQLARLDANLGAWRISGPLHAALENLPSPASLRGAPAGARASAAAASPASGASPAADGVSAGATAPTAAAPAASSPAWTAHVTGRLAGTGPPLDEGRNAVAPPPMALDLDALVRADALELKTFSLRAGAATAGVRGMVRRTAAGAWQGDARATWSQFDPGAWWRLAESGPLRTGPNLLNGALDVQLASAPSAWEGLQAIRGRADLTIASSRLGGLPFEGKASVNANTLPWNVSADLQSGPNVARAEGTIRPAASARGFLDSIEALHASVEAPDVAAFAPLSPGRWPSKGQARIDVKVEGARNALARLGAFATPGKAVRGELAPLTIVTEGELSDWTGPLVRLDRLHWTGELSTDPQAPLAVRLTVQEALWGATHVTQGQAELSGTLAEHALRVRLDAPVAPPAWLANLAGIGSAPASRVDALVQGRWDPGQVNAPQWHEHVAELELRAIAGAPGAATAASAAENGSLANSAPASAPEANRPGWLRVRPFDVAAQRDAAGRWQTLRLGAGGVDIAGLSLEWQPSFWTAPAARGQSAHWSFDAAIAPFSFAQLMARAQPDMGWRGDLQMTARMHAAFDGQWHVDGKLERTSGDLSVATDSGVPGAAVLSLGLTESVVLLQAEGGQWRADANLAGAQLGELRGRVRIDTGSPAALPSADSTVRGTLRARVNDLNIWGAWLPPGWRLGGRMRTQLSFAGRLGAPQLTGELMAENFEVRNALAGVYAHGGTIDIGLEADRASIRKFTILGGNGELSLSGGATLGASPDAKLFLDARQFQLLGRIDRRLVTSGTATIHLTADALQVEGKLGIDEGLFDVSQSTAPTLDSDVVVLQPRQAGANGEEAPERAAPPSKAARATTLLVDVDLGKSLRVKGHGIDTLLRGTLQITAPGGRLNVRGVVRTEGGQYAAYGQRLDVTRGVLTFTGPLDDPRLDILATRPNLDIIVGVAITGTALAPHVRLYSEPAMSDSDRLSWLMLGRAPETVGGADAALLQQAALALLAGEGEAPSDQLMSRLGITEFSVGQRQTEGSDTRETVVSLGRQLSRRWYLGYERGVNVATGNWQLIYRIAQRFTIRAQSGSDNALDLIWTWRWN